MSSLLSIAVLLAVASSGFCEKVFLQRAGKDFNSRQYRSVLTVNNGERFGDWTWPEMCPDNFFAVGFIPAFGNLLSSTGEWSHPQYCPGGVLTSFQIRVEPHQGLLGDDTAVNNIRFRCSSNPTLEAPGMQWGDYGYWSEDCTNGGICGIETKMEEYQWALDDSSLNDVRLFCCDKSQQ
ncbi:vitelline membrane outer layer protein 1 homolog [Poecilia formosa]|uniref:vitelline membrane outer layer protein 1 homolog n=1 Tax=Poecilia formosa TaxID=48698 RepID=UPI0007B9D6EE|nr:PREDICTED: vitelline membrane outer layer protein 1 homolog [Poecilia formosa]